MLKIDRNEVSKGGLSDRKHLDMPLPFEDFAWSMTVKSAGRMYNPNELETKRSYRACHLIGKIVKLKTKEA